MSSNEEKIEQPAVEETISREEADQIRASAKTTMYVSVIVVLVWLYGYNIVVHDMGPVLAFFKSACTAGVGIRAPKVVTICDEAREANRTASA